MVVEEKISVGDRITLLPEMFKTAYLKPGETAKVVTTNHGVLIMPKSMDMVDMMTGIFPSKEYDEDDYYLQLRQRND